LATREIRVRADVRHASEHLGQGPPSGTLESGFQDLTVLLLGTAVALGGSLLERANQFIRQVSNHQLRHGSHLGATMLSMLASKLGSGKH